MKIGILGGSFNPFHIMHKKIAMELIEKHYVDRVIVVPAGDEYTKLGLVEGMHRCRMAELSLQEVPLVEVSNYETRNKRKYTYETLQHFKKKFPLDELYFVIGADNLEELVTWKEYEWMLQNYFFLVIGRGNRDLLLLREKYAPYQEHIILTDIVTDSVSSTQVRSAMQCGEVESITNILDKDVFAYIQSNHLYERES